ncbi:MAG: GTP-binding protein [Anaerolineaceae bacterium]|nr:GTP-binding protein [Anaerolineaceae bacterium]
MHTVQKKVCLLGDFAVGKTSLIRRFVEDRFDDKYLSTIGVKISRKTLTRQDHLLNLLIWDLAGGDDFSKTSASYLRGAAGALLVCDLTRADTLATLTDYAQQLKAMDETAVLVLVANKADLVAERQISEAALAEMAETFTAPYLLTSALTGSHVEAAFHHLANAIEKPL